MNKKHYEKEKKEKKKEKRDILEIKLFKRYGNIFLETRVKNGTTSYFIRLNICV